MCHISHVYYSGASLYFTVVMRAGATTRSRNGTARRPRRTMRSARPARRSRTTTAWAPTTATTYAEEIGPLAVEVLRAVKDTLDPGGILNPGVLIAHGG